MPKAVLDPNVLISGLISPSGPSAQLLLEFRAGAFEVVASPTLVQELSDVLLREKFRRYVTEDEVHAFVEMLRIQAILVDDPEPAAEPIGSDPGDEYLIALARAESADALVSGDPHLLRLAHVMPVLSPRSFLETIRTVGGLG